MGRPRSEHDSQRRESWRRYQNKAREEKKIACRAMIAEFLDRPCVDCGVQYPAPAMQADHVRGKKHPISWFRGGNGSLRLLEAELALCEVRCANCHVLRHSRDGVALQLGR
jgi:hypothetical protein